MGVLGGARCPPVWVVIAAVVLSTHAAHGQITVWVKPDDAACSTASSTGLECGSFSAACGCLSQAFAVARAQAKSAGTQYMTVQIHLLGGTFSGPNNTNLTVSFADVPGVSSLEIMGSRNVIPFQEEAVVDCLGTGVPFLRPWVDQDAPGTVLLERFTVQNCSMPPGQAGGGALSIILTKPSSSIDPDAPKFTSLGVSMCTFINVSSTLEGGALMVYTVRDEKMPWSTCSVSVTDSRFERCASRYGGAASFLCQKIDVSGSSFHRNTAQVRTSKHDLRSTNGGALYLAYADEVHITKSEFVGNRAVDNVVSGGDYIAEGGAVSLNSVQVFFITACRFSGNAVVAMKRFGVVRGGALSVFETRYMSPSDNRCDAGFIGTLRNCVFEDNHAVPVDLGASRTRTQGGHVHAGPLMVVNSTFSRGSAGFGGAMYICWVPNTAGAPLVVMESTFSDNDAFFRGGAIVLPNHSRVSNSSFLRNGLGGDTELGGALVIPTFEKDTAESVSTLLIANVSAALNAARFGGGFLTSTGTANVDIAGGSFEGCSSGANGGVVMLPSTSRLLVYGGAVFAHNHAVGDGGVFNLALFSLVRIGGDSPGDGGVATPAVFINNTAAAGGVVYASGLTSVVLISVVSVDNAADYGGFVFSTTLHDFRALTQLCPVQPDLSLGKEKEFSFRNTHARFSGALMYLIVRDDAVFESGASYSCSDLLNIMMGMTITSIVNSTARGATCATCTAIESSPTNLVVDQGTPAGTRTHAVSSHHYWDVRVRLRDSFGSYVDYPLPEKQVVTVSASSSCVDCANSNDSLLLGTVSWLLSPGRHAVGADGGQWIGGFRLVGKQPGEHAIVFTANSEPAFSRATAELSALLEMCGPGYSQTRIHLFGLQDCEECPDSTYDLAGHGVCRSCPHQSLSCHGSHVETKRGYWLHVEDGVAHAYACRSSSACLEGSRCAAHRVNSSMNPLCGQCDEHAGFYEWGGDCVRCEGTRYDLLAAIVVISWAFVALHHFVLSGGSRGVAVTSSLSTVFFYFAQIAPLVSGSSLLYDSLFAVLSVRYSSPVCLAPWPFYERYVFALSLPMLLFVLLAATYCLETVFVSIRDRKLRADVTDWRAVMQEVHRDAGTAILSGADDNSDGGDDGGYALMPVSADGGVEGECRPEDHMSCAARASSRRGLRYVDSAIGLVMLCYTLYTSTTAQFLNCQHVADHVVLSSNPGVECYTDVYHRYLVLNTVVQVMWFLVVNGVLVWVFWRAPKSGKSAAWIHAVQRALSSKYTEANRQYDLVLQVRRTVIALFFALLSQHPVVQAWAMSTACVTFLVLHALRNPFADRIANTAETLSLLTLLLLAVIRAGVETSKTYDDEFVDSRYIATSGVAALGGIWVAIFGKRALRKVQRHF